MCLYSAHIFFLNYNINMILSKYLLLFLLDLNDID